MTCLHWSKVLETRNFNCCQTCLKKSCLHSLEQNFRGNIRSQVDPFFGVCQVASVTVIAQVQSSNSGWMLWHGLWWILLQTELNGLQWKRFAPSASSHNVNFSPGERGQEHLIYDPLLLSYGRCLNANLLTAWKRTQSVFPNNFGGPIPTASSGTSTIGNKKLWVFWYGEEPDLSPLLEPELIGKRNLSYRCLFIFRFIFGLFRRGKWWMGEWVVVRVPSSSIPCSPYTHRTVSGCPLANLLQCTKWRSIKLDWNCSSQLSKLSLPISNVKMHPFVAL